MSQPPIEMLDRQGLPALAVRHRKGGEGRLGAVWFCGFNSDMDGTKAVAVDAWAEAAGRALLRFDYSGHGRSEGEFRDGSISRWRDDALAVLDAHAQGPQLFIGSSMGAWIALLAARERPGLAAGLVLIAPAPDFTERLTTPRMSEAAKEALARDGVWLAPSAYGEPVPFTKTLFEDGRGQSVLDAPYAFGGPTHILQGTADPDVPWSHALLLAETMTGGPVSLELIKGGDHRLSTEADLARLTQRVGEVCETLDPRGGTP